MGGSPLIHVENGDNSLGGYVMNKTALIDRVAGPALTLILAATLAACGGGGGSGQPQGSSSPPAGTFVRTLSASPDFDTNMPFNTDLQSRVQQLYPAEWIRASGYINSLGFTRYSDQADPVTCNEVTIKLGHTDEPELDYPGSANVENGEGSHVTVLDNDTVIIPAGNAGEYFDIPLSAPFYYNGKDNLVVEVLRTTECDGEVLLAWAYKSNAAFESGYVVEPYGTTTDAYRPARFRFAGGDTQVHPQGVASTSYVPFQGLYLDRRAQFLYRSGDINGEGPIAGIAFKSGDPPGADSAYTVDITLGHTTLSSLEPAFADNINVGSPVTVASQLEFVIPAYMPAGSMIWLPMTSTFDYNGTDNLVVDIKVTSAPNSPLPLTASATGAGVRRIAASSTDPVAGLSDATVPHIGVRFHGGKVGVLRSIATGWIDGAVYTDTFPFGLDPAGRRQYLYRSAELGGSGQITRLACRIGNNDVDMVEGDYTVTLAHTTATTLVSGFETNLTNPTTTNRTTVHSGPLIMPARLQGDWQEFPLPTPFAYNGKDNLIVEIRGTTSEPLWGGCLTAGDHEYLTANRRLGWHTADAEIGSLYHLLPDMLFDIER
jgi:hypothetical protein